MPIPFLSRFFLLNVLTCRCCCSFSAAVFQRQRGKREREGKRERKRETGERNSGLDDTSIHYTDSLIPLVMPIPFLSYLSLLLFVSVVFIRKIERERKERERREREKERESDQKIEECLMPVSPITLTMPIPFPSRFFSYPWLLLFVFCQKEKREWEKKRVEKKLSRADPICIIIRFPSSRFPHANSIPL